MSETRFPFCSSLTLQGRPARVLFSLCPQLHSCSGPLTRAADTPFLAPHSFLCSDTLVVFLNRAHSLIFLSLSFPSAESSVEMAPGFPEEGIPQCVGETWYLLGPLMVEGSRSHALHLRWALFMPTGPGTSKALPLAICPF